MELCAGHAMLCGAAWRLRSPRISLGALSIFFPFRLCGCSSHRSHHPHAGLCNPRGTERPANPWLQCLRPPVARALKSSACTLGRLARLGPGRQDCLWRISGPGYIHDLMREDRLPLELSQYHLVSAPAWRLEFGPERESVPPLASDLVQRRSVKRAQNSHGKAPLNSGG